MTREKIVNLSKQLDKERRRNSRKRKQADKRKQRQENDREPTVEEWDAGDYTYWDGKGW